MERGELTWVSTEQIHITPGANPRKRMDPERLHQLAESIRIHGILNPLVVRPRPDGGYELICGERRLMAARMVGLDSVPARVVHVDDREAAEMRILENLQREDLDPIEEALAYRQLCDLCGYTFDQLAQRLGISKTQVSERIRLLELPEEVQEYLSRKQLSPSAGELLLRLRDYPEVQVDLARRAAEYRWSVRELEIRIQSALTWMEARRVVEGNGHGDRGVVPAPERAVPAPEEQERAWEEEELARLRWEAVVAAAVEHLAPRADSPALWAVLAGIAAVEGEEEHLRRLFRLAGMSPYAPPSELPRAVQALVRSGVPVQELRRLTVRALLSDRYWAPMVTEVLYEALPEPVRAQVDERVQAPRRPARR